MQNMDKFERLTIDSLQAKLIMTIFKLKLDEISCKSALELADIADNLNKSNLKFIEEISKLPKIYQYPDINYFLTDDIEEIKTKINYNIEHVETIRRLTASDQDES